MKCKNIKFRILFLLTALCLLFLCACAGKPFGTGSESPFGENAEKPHGTNAGESAGGKGRDEDRAQASGSSLRENASLYFQQFLPLKLDDPEGYASRILRYDTLGDTLYLLAQYRTEERPDALLLYIFHADTQQSQCQLFEPEELPEDSVLFSLDILPDATLSLRFRKEESSQENGGPQDVLLHTDLQGKVLSREEGFQSSERYPWNADLLNGDRWRTFDTPDGTFLGVSEDRASVTLYSFDAESGKRYALAAMEGSSLCGLCAEPDSQNTVFYLLNSGRLVRYDTKKQTGDILLNLYEQGIPSYSLQNSLLLGSSGDVFICSLESDIPGIYVFADHEPPREERALRLAQVYSSEFQMISQSVARYSQSHKQTPITVETESKADQQDAFRDRILLEMSTGGGPDLLWVTESDMLMLSDRGLLMDLTEFLPKESAEQIFPGVLELGSPDGRLVGIVPCLQLSSMITSENTWKKKTWTRGEFLELIDARAPELTFPVSYLGSSLDCLTLLQWVLLADYEEFVDPESGRCDFDSDTFRKILEIAKKYGSLERVSRDTVRLLQEGESLAHIEFYYAGIAAYPQGMLEYGDGFHTVGFPTTNGDNESFVYSFAYLVVNANTERTEEIKEFLGYLLDYGTQAKNMENQGTLSCSIRRDVLKDYMKTAQVPYSYTDGGKKEGMEALWKKYQEEFLEMAEGCRPRYFAKMPQIAVIIGELADEYFRGDRDLDETVRLIQNRVQLYLNENR